MTVQREDVLAWELVEQYRDLLTAEERTAIFLSLGVGDYPLAIRGVLTAVATQKKALTARTAADVQAWIDCYDNGFEFGALLSRVCYPTTFDEDGAATPSAAMPTL